MSNAFLNALPPLFLLLIFGFAYYVNLYYYCLGAVKTLRYQIILIIILNCITVMFLWSFFATMFFSVGKVPEEYKFTKNRHSVLLKARTEDDKDDILDQHCEYHNLLLHTRTPTGSIRYCVACMHIKPDRAHHCTTCQVCSLRMDHHCPWVNNCIGYRNYKNFLLLIFYTSLFCLYFVFSTLKCVLDTIYDESFWTNLPLCLGFGLAVVIGLVTLGFLCYHLHLVSINETTLENVHSPTFVEEDITFDLGTRQNFVEIFGTRCYLWLLPVFSSMGNGYMFLVTRK